MENKGDFMKYIVFRCLLVVLLFTIMLSTLSCSRENSRESQLDSNEIKNTEDSKEGIGRDKVYWKFPTGGKILSSPIIVDNVVYFGCSDGNLYAVNKDTGNEIWRYTLGADICCQPAILDHKLFICGEEIYVAVDAKTGKELWRQDQSLDVTYTRRLDQWDYHDSSPIIDKEVVYYGSRSGNIFGFDVNSGMLVWKFAASEKSAVRTTPIIDNGVLYYGDWDGFYRAVDIAEKKVLWENSYKYVFQSGAAITNGVLFIGGRDTNFYAIDCKTGKSIWSYTEPNRSWITGDPLIDGDIVYFPTSDAKTVYAMRINDGSIVAKYPIYKNAFSKAIIDKEKLYVTSGDVYAYPGTGKLEVYSLKENGKRVDEFSIDSGRIFSSPVIKDGIAYFGSTDTYFYAVKIG